MGLVSGTFRRRLLPSVPDFLGTRFAMKTLFLVPLLLVAVLAQPRHGGHPQPRHRAMSKAEFVASDLALEAGLEDLPCGNGAGGLNGCGVAAAIVIGFCACQSENSDDTLDKDKFCNCYTDDEGTGWGSCQDCADVMLTAYHKMTPTFPETCANNANGFEGLMRSMMHMQGPSVEERKIATAKMAKKVFERAGGDPCQDIRCSFLGLTAIGYGYCHAGGDPATDTEPDHDKFCSFWTKHILDANLPPGCKECAAELLEYFGAVESGLPSECDSSESF